LNQKYTFYKNFCFKETRNFQGVNVSMMRDYIHTWSISGYKAGIDEFHDTFVHWFCVYNQSGK